MSNNGVLGSRNLLAGTNQAVYVNNYSDIAVVAVNVCNQNQLPIEIKLAVSTSSTSPSNSEWLEYDVEVLGKSVLLRTGILVGPNDYVVVQSSRSKVNAMVWGTEVGTVSLTPVIITTNNVTPVWSTSATLPDITSSRFVEIPLSAT
jgi:hypothetical protein